MREAHALLETEYIVSNWLSPDVFPQSKCLLNEQQNYILEQPGDKKVGFINVECPFEKWLYIRNRLFRAY